ncbi:AraC family transcriptional regulator [Sessilibacter sp. MAH2]
MTITVTPVPAQPFGIVSTKESSISAQRKDSALSKLASLIDRCTPHSGCIVLPMEGVRVFKSTEKLYDVVPVLSKPGLCIVAQGQKCVKIGQDQYEYGESSIAIYPAELPVNSSIVGASPEKPYLCVVVDIDVNKLTELVSKIFVSQAPMTKSFQPLYVGDADPKIIDAATRLLELYTNQDEMHLLYPLIVEEILIRLLKSPVGAHVAQLGVADSNMLKITKAINWLNDHFEQPVKVDELANLSNMSPSSFHQHFKNITSMTPVQYQKNLRLQQARQLMFYQTVDVSEACLRVGYASLSQFSREYSRYFGNSPTKDVNAFRQGILN